MTHLRRTRPRLQQQHHFCWPKPHWNLQHVRLKNRIHNSIHAAEDLLITMMETPNQSHPQITLHVEYLKKMDVATECQETECQGDRVPRDWVPRDWVPGRLSAKETECQERLSAKETECQVGLSAKETECQVGLSAKRDWVPSGTECQGRLSAKRDWVQRKTECQEKKIMYKKWFVFKNCWSVTVFIIQFIYNCYIEYICVFLFVNIARTIFQNIHNL